MRSRCKPPVRRGLLAAITAALAACSAPAAAPTPVPTAAPTRTSPPAATPAPTVDAAAADAQDAFLTNVNDLTSEVETLATAPCADLAIETRANPTEVAEIHRFAATLQSIGANQPALDSDDVRSALSDLSKAMTQFDTALTACGISTS